MARRSVRIVVPVVAAGLVAGLAVAGRGGTPPPTTEAPAAGGLGGAPIDPPRRLTQGDFASSLGTIAALEDGARALEADREKTAATGSVGGLTIRAESEPAPECDVGHRALTEDELGAHEIPTPGYLPPGAFEYETQFGVACDDRPLFVQRRFLLEPEQATIVAVRWLDTKEVRAQASLERVDADARVNGRPAVLIRPVASTGYGNSWIFIHDGDGLLQLAGVNLPFDELLSVARGLS